MVSGEKMNKVRIQQINRVYRFSSNKCNWSRLPHENDHFIAYKLYGKTIHIYQGKSYEFCKDEIMLVNGNDYYQVIDHEREWNQTRGSCIAVHFSTVDPCDFHFTISGKQHDSQIKSCFFSILDAWNRYNASQRAEIEYRCFALLYEILGLYLASSTKREYEPQSILAGKEYIERNFADSTLTVARAAAQSGLSQRRFGELFQKTYDITPGKFLTQCRLNHAQELLLSKLTISEIARLVGFTDPSYFIRVFHKNMDITPHGFRVQQSER